MTLNPLIRLLPHGRRFRRGGVTKNPEMEISFCQFKLGRDLKEAHASFTVGYAFKLGADGKPRNVRKLLGDELSVEQAAECIAKWQFRNAAPNSLVTAYFRWDHGVGWTELKVSGKNFSQTIKIEGERCPY